MAGFWSSRKSSSNGDESNQSSSQSKESRKPGSRFSYFSTFLAMFWCFEFYLFEFERRIRPIVFTGINSRTFIIS